MRNRFDRQLLELNNELIQMGSLIEQAIGKTGCRKSRAGDQI